MDLVGAIIVYQDSPAGWQQVGNTILGEEPQTRIQPLAINDEGTRLLATDGDNQQRLFEYRLACTRTTVADYPHQ